MNKLQRLILGSASVGIFGVSSISAMAALTANTVSASKGRASIIVETEAANTTNTIVSYADTTNESITAVDVAIVRASSDSKMREEYI